MSNREQAGPPGPRAWCPHGCGNWVDNIGVPGPHGAVVVLLGTDPAVPQLPGTGLTNRLPVRWHEDCLTLNISTPALDDLKRPVLVWINGCAFRTGQGAIPWYNEAGPSL